MKPEYTEKNTDLSVHLTMSRIQTHNVSGDRQCRLNAWARWAVAVLIYVCCVRHVFFLYLNTDFVGSTCTNTISICLILLTLTDLFLQVVVWIRTPQANVFPGAYYAVNTVLVIGTDCI